MTTATQTQIRRDTATNLNAATPASGELAYDTTNKRVAVGDGSTAGGTKLPNANDLQSQKFIVGTVGGTADVITITNSPVVAAYVSGLKVVLKATGTNTTAPTVNVDGLGAKNIKKMSNGALASLAAGDIVSGGIYDLFYDGTQFQIKGLAEGPFSSGNLKFLGSVVASSSSTIDFTSLMSSTYDDYIITVDAARSASGANFVAQTSVNNGSSFDAGSGNYKWSFAQSNNSAVSNIASTSDTFIKMTQTIDTAATAAICGHIHVHSVNDTTNHKRLTWLLHFEDSSANPTTTVGGGNRGATTAVNAIRLKFDSGAVTSGTFRMYGLTNS